MSQPVLRMIVFDMAGTVVDEKNVVYKTLRYALRDGGYPFSLQDVLTVAGGKEKQQAIKDLIATSHNSPGADAAQVYATFLALLDTAYSELDVTPYPGVEPMLHRLKEQGIKVVLNTGYTTRTARQLLKKMGWQDGKQYDRLVTADDVPRSRPAPDMILLAMDRLGVPLGQEVAKVGDSEVDIQEGQAAHCRFTVGVTTGAHSKEQLARANPTLIVDSLSTLDTQLQAMLDAW